MNPENVWVQYSERTDASTETNDTSAKNPWSQLIFGTLKVIVSFKLTSGEVIEVKKSKNPWLGVKKINKICFSRQAGVAPSWQCHTQFQDFKWKLKSRAFSWCIVWFYTSNSSFRKLKTAKKLFCVEPLKFVQCVS